MKIAVLGVGRMGAWFCNLLRKEHDVAVYDPGPGKLETVTGVARLAEPAGLRFYKPDLLLNAVSLEHTLSAFQAARPHLPGSCILADVASIKTGLAEYYDRTSARFVSIHPMFGPTFADMESLKEHNAVIITGSDPAGACFFQDLFTQLGLQLFQYSFEEHDQMMAYSLTLPFISSLMFASGVDRQAVPGTTFKKHLHIAEGLLSEDDHLLAEVLFNPHSLLEVEKVTSRLEFLKHIIRQKDHEEAKRFFHRLRANIAP